MNRFRKRDEAVSPVIATILMVAITVVLAGVLVVYLQTLPQGGGGAENPVGLSVQKNSAGNWLVSVSSGGGQNTGDVTISVTNANTGASIFNAKLNTFSANFIYNDNNIDSKVNSGDSILLNATASGGLCAAGYKVQLLKGESVIGTVKELPS